MKDSFFFPPEDKKSRIAMVYMRKDGKRLVRAGEKAQGGDSAAYRSGAKYAGPELAMFSTATDLYGFYQMLANRGTFAPCLPEADQARERLWSHSGDRQRTAIATNASQPGNIWA